MSPAVEEDVDVQGGRAATAPPPGSINDDPSEALSQPPAAHLPLRRHGNSLPAAKPSSSLPRRCAAAAVGGALPGRSGAAVAAPPFLHRSGSEVKIPSSSMVQRPHGKSVATLGTAPPIPPPPRDKSSPPRLPPQDQKEGSPQCGGICPAPAEGSPQGGGICPAPADTAAASAPPLGERSPLQGDALLCNDVLPKYSDTLLQMDAIAAQLEVGAPRTATPVPVPVPAPVPRAAAPAFSPPSPDAVHPGAVCALC